MSMESIKTIAKQLFKECWGTGKLEILQEIMAENHIIESWPGHNGLPQLLQVGIIKI